MLPRFFATMLFVLAGCFRCLAAPPPPYMDLYPVVSVAEFPVAGVPFTMEVKVTHELSPFFTQHAWAASNVVLEVQLPPELELISCTVDPWQRSYFATNPADPATVTNNGGYIRCELGTIYKVFHRAVQVTVRPARAGTFDCTTRVNGEGGYEYPAGNNNLVSPVQVHTNGLVVVGGRSVPEQSGGSARFEVRLIRPQPETVTVDYFTVDGSATAGEDYAPVSGTLVFAPGVSNLNVLVPVLDDSLGEVPSQSFSLQLTNAIHADVSHLSAPNFVLDDEPLIEVSIDDAAPVREGHLTTDLTFAVRFSRPSDVPIVVGYSATGAASVSGMYTNPPRATNAVLDFTVVGNVTPESNRVVNVTLLDPYFLVYPWFRVGLGRATAEGVIIDDDGGPGDFHHLEISTVPSPQIAGRPFPVYIYAKDVFDNPATNYASDRVEVDLYRVVNFNSTIIQTVYVSNFVDGVGVAMMTSTNAQNRLNVTAWKPVGEWSHVTAISPEFRAIASPPLFLSLSVSTATEGDGMLAGAGRVSITNIDLVDVVVELASSDTQQIQVPPSVIIPAGQTSAVFDVMIVDDELFDGTRPANVVVNSLGYIGALRMITALDNEPALLTVLLPDGLSEAKGLNTGTATVHFDRPLDGGASLSLISSNTARLTVPGSVWVGGGQTSATFNVSVPDNAVIDGPQTVVVSASFSAAARGWASTVVQDNDTNITLTVYLGNDLPIEGLGTRTNVLTVRIGGVTTNDVTVQLASANPDKVIVPEFVTIPAGQLSVATALTILNDQEASGDERVPLTGSAPGFLPGTNTFTVYDDDVHHFTLSPVGISQTSGVPFAVGFAVRGPTNATMTFFRGAVSLSAFADGGPLPVMPAVLSNLVRGTWSGPVTIQGWGTNVQLIVTAPGNTAQTNSNPFDVAPPEWAVQSRIKELRRDAHGVRVIFDSDTNGAYQLHVMTNLSLLPWMPLGSPLNGSGAEMSVNDAVSSSEQRFYRLEVRPR